LLFLPPSSAIAAPLHTGSLPYLAFGFVLPLPTTLHVDLFPFAAASYQMSSLTIQ